MNGLVQKIKDYTLIGGVSLLLFGGIGGCSHSYFFSDSIETKINDLQIKRYGKKDKYLVFTDAGVFENTSAWYRGKWSSSDFQNKLVALKGKNVKLKKYGRRVQLLHWYENLISAEEIKR